MILFTQRAKPEYLSCTGRPAACRRIGLHVVKPRDRGRLVSHGSLRTRVSAMRTHGRAVAIRLAIRRRRWLTERAGVPCAGVR